MDSNQLNRWLRLAAQVGTIVGIFLVIYELNQNRELMKSRIRNDLTAGIVTLQQGVSENSQLADVIARAVAGQKLTPGEALQFGNQLSAIYRYWENVHYQYRAGLFDEAEFSTQKRAWDLLLNDNAANVRHWCSTRNMYSPEFVVEINMLLNKFKC